MRKFYFLLPLIIFSSCTLAPKYERPLAPVPLEKADSAKADITKASWEEYFQSADLQRVIKIALENNRDLRVANLNMESARQIHNVVRSELLPTINLEGTATYQKIPNGVTNFGQDEQYQTNANITAYELDFFGRLRSLNKASMEDFLATKEARNITKISLITQTAQAYINLILDGEILKSAQANWDAQKENHRLSKLRYDNGVDSQLDLLVAADSLENAGALYETYKKIIVEDKNALMTLMGVFDEKLLPQNIAIKDVKINESLLNFVPSESLLSRPDIKEAEHKLKSANADIGAARAAFFPSITLTGLAGYQSYDLNSLFRSETWLFSPQVTLPIFTAGKGIANLKLSNLRKKIEIANYEKAIQTAFSEASTELAQREAVANRLKSFDEILKTRQKTYAINELRYREGISSRVTITEGRIYLLTAEQNQATIQKEYLTNLIKLYKVLGGGSELE